MDAGGDQDDEDLRGHQHTLRSIRKEVRLLGQNGISIAGFDDIRGFSYSFLKALVDLALEDGDPNDAVAANIATLLTRAMVPYSRIAAFAIQPKDPDEYHMALANGLRSAVGLASGDISATNLLKLLDSLVGAVDENARGLAKPFEMLHGLVTDFLKMRDEIATPQQPTQRELQLRASELQDSNYWNSLAASLSQSSTWLGQNPDFINLGTMPPLSWGGNAHIMACDLEDLDQGSDALRNLWIWKESHMVLVSDAIGQQPTLKHPRDELPSDNAPKAKKSRKSKNSRKAAKNRAEQEKEKAEANPACNGMHATVAGDQDFDDDPGLVNYAVPVGPNAAMAIVTASPDWALLSVEDEMAQGCLRDLSGYEAEDSDLHVMPLRCRRRRRHRAPTHPHPRQTLECSDSGTDGENQKGVEEQRERSSGTELSSIDSSANPQLKQVYAIADKILQDEHEQDKIYTKAKLSLMKAERSCFDDLMAANGKMAQKKMDILWKLVDMFKAPDDDY